METDILLSSNGTLWSDIKAGLLLLLETVFPGVCGITLSWLLVIDFFLLAPTGSLNVGLIQSVLGL